MAKEALRDNMKYEISDIVTLNDGNDYVVVSIAKYLDDDYAFLIDINNKRNAFYARIKEDNLIALGSKNEELIEILTKLFEKPVFDFLKENQTN